VETRKTKHECEFFGIFTSSFNADARRNDYDYGMEVNRRHDMHDGGYDVQTQRPDLTLQTSQDYLSRAERAWSIRREFIRRDHPSERTFIPTLSKHEDCERYKAPRVESRPARITAPPGIEEAARDERWQDKEVTLDKEEQHQH
jgi:hypothetical protein